MSANHQNEHADDDGMRTEQALRTSELSYRRLFEAARDGILILDFDTGCITDVNPFLFKLLGFSRDEMIGKTVGELSPFKDMQSNKIMRHRLQEDGYVRYEDLPLESRDGRKIAVEFVSNVYLLGDKKVIQCNVRDITERKAAEKERLRLASIIECSEEAIVSTTATGTVIGWNHGAERLYGYTAEEMIGHPVTILLPPEHYLEYQRMMKEISYGNGVPPFDTVRQRKDGTLVSVSVAITPIEAHDAGTFGASKISHDITRIKKLEAQCIETQKMDVLGQLACGVAHDFNNILAVIMGYSDLAIQKLPLGDEFKSYLETIRAAADRAAGLTRQLLVFSRKETVHLIVLDINDVVKDMDQMLRRLIDESVEMTILPGQQIWRVKADSGYIGQVLMNLVVNARDAMPNGGKLRIATSNVTLDENYAQAHEGVIPGNYAMLTVSDTGTGIRDEVKARLFEAFFTTKPRGKGTGLGLATCKTIVQQCGGHIDVYSVVGGGTTFKIYLPRVEQSPDVAARPIQPGPLPRGTETLLVVEDDLAVRNLIRSPRLPAKYAKCWIRRKRKSDTAI
jgi:PAS domain S-box-containing protein